ncbi:MAG: DUF4363 family protein [Clostridia bacterium]|nr:DUF4363 family protein [Clostridia bacterium]
MTKGRLTVALIILLFVVGLGIGEQIFIHRTFDEFTERLESFIVEEDETYDYSAIVETQKWWEKKVHYLELFLPHVQMNEITITYGELVGAVGAEDFDSAQALLNRLQQTSIAFEEMYGFRIGNII